MYTTSTWRRKGIRTRAIKTSVAERLEIQTAASIFRLGFAKKKTAYCYHFPASKHLTFDPIQATMKFSNIAVASALFFSAGAQAFTAAPLTRFGVQVRCFSDVSCRVE